MSGARKRPPLPPLPPPLPRGSGYKRTRSPGGGAGAGGHSGWSGVHVHLGIAAKCTDTQRQPKMEAFVAIKMFCLGAV